MYLEQPGSPDSTLAPSPGGQTETVIVDNDLEANAGNETPEEEFEDIELDDGVRKVPKGLKDYVMRSKDYTLKTQELAEQRRAMESERQEHSQRQQLQQAHMQDIARVMAIDERLQQFQQINWDALTDADPQQALKLERQMRMLKDTREQLAQKITTSAERMSLESKQAAAKRHQEAQASLERDIPNWSSKEVRQGIHKAARAAGYTDEILEKTDFAPFIKLAHKAYLYDQISKQRSAPAEPPKPTTVVGGPSKAVTGYTPTMTDAQFAKWRRAQIAQRH